MKVGDRVQIVKIPDHLPDDEIRELELCQGRDFLIEEIDEHGLVSLDISAATGQKPGSSGISIQPEYVKLV